MIEIVGKQIDIPQVLASVRSKTAGGVVHFIGVVRDAPLPSKLEVRDSPDHQIPAVRDDERIEGLTYESYPEMAVSEMKRIVEEAGRRWPVEGVTVVHRIGWIPVGEEAVVVAVGSCHRAEAFEACRFVIDRVKEEVPIWKEAAA